MRRSFKIYSAICVVVFLASVFFSSAIPGQLLAFFAPQPENVTELYFEDHLSLPNRIAPHTTYPFHFTIHNATDKDQDYQYEMSAQVDGERVIWDKSSVNIGKGETQTIEEQFATAESVPRQTKITIQLLNTDQHIDFIAEAGQ